MLCTAKMDGGVDMYGEEDDDCGDYKLQSGRPLGMLCTAKMDGGVDSMARKMMTSATTSCSQAGLLYCRERCGGGVVK